VLGPLKFQVVTTHPVNPEWFIFNAISGLAPLPKHAWEKYTLDQQFQLQSTPGFYDVVDGPVKLQSFVVGQDAVFVPNPAWQGAKAHFARMVFRFLQGDGSELQGVESGDLDEGALPTDLYHAVKDFTGSHVEILPQSTYQNVINLNLKNPQMIFFRDVRVRQAMEDAIDQDAIVNGLEHGHGDSAYGPVPHTMTKFLTPDMRKAIYPVGYDPAKARALLAEAGFSPGPDGIMQKDGKRLSFTDLEETGTNAITELDEIIQADFRRAGIEMKIHQIEFNQMLALMSGPSPTGWEATGTGLGIGDYPSGEAQFQTGSYQNMGGYSDPKMDALIKANIDQPGDDKLFAYETYVSMQQPVIFGPRERAVILVNNRLHGMGGFINPAGMYAPDQLYCTVGGAKS
jgi:peptide/nickel transport system substrate-binding protein